MHSGRSCIASRNFVCRQPFNERQFIAHQYEVNTMNANTLANDDTDTLLTVTADPVRLRLPVGSAMLVYSGEVWITQEGMLDDVVLAPGKRFDVRSNRLIVVSAVRGSARVYAASRIDIAACIDSDLLAFLRRRGRRLRTEYFTRVVQSTKERALSLLSAVFVSVRKASMPATQRYF